MDFARANVPEDLTALLQRPLIVPDLTGISVEDEEGDIANVDRRAPIAKRIASGAQKIASTARRMVRRTKVDISTADKSDKRCIHEINQNFSRKIISYEEKKWFEERVEAKKVLEILAKEQDLERAKPWFWFREPDLNRDALSAETRRLADENERAHRHKFEFLYCFK